MAKAFAVIQEGGSSVEAYLHVSENEGGAQAYRVDCAGSAYRTSEILEIEVDDSGRISLDDAASLISMAGARDYDFPEEE